MYRFEVVSDEHRKNPDVDIQLPKRGTNNACAYDFFSPISATIPPGESLMIWTDVKACISYRCALLLNVRSSMGKYGITLANTQGWIDADYYSNPSNDGNIGIFLHNNSMFTPFVIHQGDRIAQGMIVPYCIMDDDAVEGMVERIGGFGSTGK